MAESTETDGDEGGYFALGERARSASPDSIHSDPLSIQLQAPSVTIASLTALQYLPMPLLVLDDHKTVTLANEAMGRLLGINFECTAFQGSSITEILHGKVMSELGVDLLQNGSPLLITWEVCPALEKR